MSDGYLSHEWSDHHASVSAAFHRLMDDLRSSFERLHHFQFEAPWRE